MPQDSVQRTGKHPCAAKARPRAQLEASRVDLVRLKCFFAFPLVEEDCPYSRIYSCALCNSDYAQHQFGETNREPDYPIDANSPLRKALVTANVSPFTSLASFSRFCMTLPWRASARTGHNFAEYCGRTKLDLKQNGYQDFSYQTKLVRDMLQKRDSMGKAARYWLLKASVIFNKRIKQ